MILFKSVIMLLILVPKINSLTTSGEVFTPFEAIGNVLLHEGPYEQLTQYPYPVRVRRFVPYQVPKLYEDEETPVTVPRKPYPVTVTRTVQVPVPKSYPYIQVPSPYPVPLTRTVQVPRPKPYPVTVTKTVQVPVPKPYPVEVTGTKTVPVHVKVPVYV